MHWPKVCWAIPLGVYATGQGDSALAVVAPTALRLRYIGSNFQRIRHLSKADAEVVPIE